MRLRAAGHPGAGATCFKIADRSPVFLGLAALVRADGVEQVRLETGHPT